MDFSGIHLSGAEVNLGRSFGHHGTGMYGTGLPPFVLGCGKSCLGFLAVRLGHDTGDFEGKSAFLK